MLEGYPTTEAVLALIPSGGSESVLISDRAHVSTKLTNGFDRQKKAGKNFGRVKFLGIEPAKFTVTFEVLAGPEEDNFKDKVIPLLRRPGRKGNSPPFDVYFGPQITQYGVDTVTIVSSDIGPPNPRTGRIVSLELEEWTPAPVEPKPDNRGSKANNEVLGLSAGLASSVEAANQ